MNEPCIEDFQILYLNAEINEDSAGYIIKNIIEMNSVEHEIDHIKVLINTQGGDVQHSLAIVDMFNASKIPIYTYGIGHVFSGGLIALMAGTPGHRYLFKNTVLMTHQWIGNFDGKQHEFTSWEKGSKILNNNIMNLYKKCTGLSTKTIKSKLLPSSDIYLSVDDAIKYKIADEVIETFP